MILFNILIHKDQNMNGDPRNRPNGPDGNQNMNVGPRNRPNGPDGDQNMNGGPRNRPHRRHPCLNNNNQTEVYSKFIALNLSEPDQN